MKLLHEPMAVAIHRHAIIWYKYSFINAINIILFDENGIIFFAIKETNFLKRRLSLKLSLFKRGFV
jgi:hypothetical protein